MDKKKFMNISGIIYVVNTNTNHVYLYFGIDNRLIVLFSCRQINRTSSCVVKKTGLNGRQCYGIYRLTHKVQSVHKKVQVEKDAPKFLPENVTSFQKIRR